MKIKKLIFLSGFRNYNEYSEISIWKKRLTIHKIANNGFSLQMLIDTKYKKIAIRPYYANE